MNQNEIENLGITEDELDQQCEELFDQTPIEFQPRKNSEMDQMIQMYIQELNLTIPIVQIKESLYLIGCSRCSCIIKRDQLLIKKGGGYEKFEDYVTSNMKYFQRMLVVYMIKSGESLEYVVDQLVNNKKIRNMNADFNGRSSSPGGNSARSGRDVSPGERKYLQQRDQIMNDLRNVM